MARGKVGSHRGAPGALALVLCATQAFAQERGSRVWRPVEGERLALSLRTFERTRTGADEELALSLRSELALHVLRVADGAATVAVVRSDVRFDVTRGGRRVRYGPGEPRRDEALRALSTEIGGLPMDYELVVDLASGRPRGLRVHGYLGGKAADPVYADERELALLREALAPFDAPRGDAWRNERRERLRQGVLVRVSRCSVEAADDDHVRVRELLESATLEPYADGARRPLTARGHGEATIELARGRVLQRRAWSSVEVEVERAGARVVQEREQDLAVMFLRGSPPPPR